MSRFVWPRQAQLLAVVISLLLAQLALKVLGSVFRLHWIGKFAFIAVAVVIDMLAVIPSVGSLLLLAHGRLEDQVFVRALVDQSDTVVASFFASGATLNFVGQTGLWFALLLALAGVVNDLANYLFLFLMSNFPKEAQQQIYQSLDYAEKAFLAIVAYDDDVNPDASIGDKPEPYSEAAFGAAVKSVKGYFKRVVLFTILPFGASLVLSKRSLTKALLRSWSCYKTFSNYRKMDRALASSSNSAQLSKAAGA